VNGNAIPRVKLLAIILPLLLLIYGCTSPPDTALVTEVEAEAKQLGRGMWAK
jgi:hypothetical protein